MINKIAKKDIKHALYEPDSSKTDTHNNVNIMRLIYYSVKLYMKTNVINIFFLLNLHLNFNGHYYNNFI